MPAEAVAVPLTVGPGLRSSVAWRETDKTSSTPSDRGSMAGQAQSRMNDTELIREAQRDRKSTRLNSSHLGISYAVFCLKDTATTEIYTLSLHDALPISLLPLTEGPWRGRPRAA